MTSINEIEDEERDTAGLSVIIWPYGPGRKQLAFCIDSDQHDPELVFEVRTEAALRLDSAIANEVRAGEERGRQQMIAALRDRDGLGAWMKARVDRAFFAGDENPPWPINQYPPSAEYADYLEHVAKEMSNG